MGSKKSTEQEIEQFLRLTRSLLEEGISGSRQIDSAFDEFNKVFGLVVRSSFVDKAVIDMLTDSLHKLEIVIKAQVTSMTADYTKASQWFSFFFGEAADENPDPGAQAAQSRANAAEQTKPHEHSQEVKNRDTDETQVDEKLLR